MFKNVPSARADKATDYRNSKCPLNECPSVCLCALNRNLIKATPNQAEPTEIQHKPLYDLPLLA
jgi:hypothetical protein